MTGTSPEIAQVRRDFDRITLISDEGWDHNHHYHALLLRQIPSRCRDVLEVGCGTGSFARRLADRADRVLALDVSPEMVRVARERSADRHNIDFELADVLTRPLPADHFDAAISIATLHHLPFGPALSRLAATLRPGGTLVVLDLYQRSGPIDRLLDFVVVPVSHAVYLATCGRLRQPEEVRRAWAEHGAHDHFLTLAEVRGAARDVVSGAVIRRHLFWRYSLIWRRPL
jgi:SAM-dependent methyltransferase